MKTVATPKPVRRTAPKPRLHPCDQHEVLTRLGDRWTYMALALLFEAPGQRLRFSELKTGIAGISRRMLTVTLRHLERDGLAIREVFPEVPPRVEYELTDMGRSILPAMESFSCWIRAHWPSIVTSRQSYDRR